MTTASILVPCLSCAGPVLGVQTAVCGLKTQPGCRSLGCWGGLHGEAEGAGGRAVTLGTSLTLLNRSHLVGGTPTADTERLWGGWVRAGRGGAPGAAGTSVEARPVTPRAHTARPWRSCASGSSLQDFPLLLRPQSPASSPSWAVTLRAGARWLILESVSKAPSLKRVPALPPRSGCVSPGPARGAVRRLIARGRLTRSVHFAPGGFLLGTSTVS